MYLVTKQDSTSSLPLSPTRPCPNLSCSWWRGASAASPTSPSRACCSGGVTSRRGVGAVLSGAVSGILRGLCPASRGSLSCPCFQGYLAPLERPGLLPSCHPPPGQSREVQARRQDRLHRRRVALLGRVHPPRSRPPSFFPLLSSTAYPHPSLLSSTFDPPSLLPPCLDRLLTLDDYRVSLPC